ncbi:MAG TPA: aspartate/glutamate/uridylate kinase [Stellaceae bacterium]|nr:aspartate/glutamate/uridylate kinase [Stellaceae bacterium]
MIVVKLGGSLGKAETLRPWLAALARAPGRAVVVPGGGAFADCVRAEQPRMGFSDRAAHRMALLAMEQYALAMADLEPRLALCASVAEIDAALGRETIPVWLPSAMALADPAIAESWDVTSDSLAAWLAPRLRARRLALVKSVPAPVSLDPAALAASGAVDRAFPQFFAAADVALDWIGPGEEARLARLLAV